MRKLQAYSNWRESKSNKDDPKFYEGPVFRMMYRLFEMPKRVCTFKRTADKYIQPLLMSLPKYATLRVLSVGCGPGSDFPGVCWSVQSHCNMLDCGISSVEYLGIDLTHWDWCEEKNERDLLLRLPTRLDFKGTATFMVQDACSFIRSSSDKYHLIVFNYAGVQYMMDLFKYGAAFKILDNPGRILVIDNYIRNVKRLTYYGFKCMEHNEVYGLWLYENTPDGTVSLGGVPIPVSDNYAYHCYDENYKNSVFSSPRYA